MGEFSDYWQQLESEGFIIQHALSGAPVELIGFLPTGEGFHFRARGESITFSVYKADRAEKDEEGYPSFSDWFNPNFRVRWDSEENDPFIFSWLSPEEIDAHLKSMLTEYRISVSIPSTDRTVDED